MPRGEALLPDVSLQTGGPQANARNGEIGARIRGSEPMPRSAPQRPRKERYGKTMRKKPLP